MWGSVAAQKISQAEVNEQMVSLARAGNVVARLKSGDPLLFGRAGEEMEALREAGIEFEVIPRSDGGAGRGGGGPISLTDRRHASRVVFVTAHRSDGRDWPTNAHVAEDTTYVIYMPGNRYAELSAELRSSGNWRGYSVRCDVPRNNSRRDNLPDHGREIAVVPAAAAPSLLIVGSVAGVGRRRIRPTESIRASFPGNSESCDATSISSFIGRSSVE